MMQEICPNCHAAVSDCTCSDALPKWADVYAHERKLARTRKNAYTLEQLEIKRKAKRIKRQKAKRIKKRGH